MFRIHEISVKLDGLIRENNDRPDYLWVSKKKV